MVDLIRRRPELITTLLCAVVLAIGIRGPDLPAQNYRVWLLRTHGLIIFDSHWYAGHTLPGYSLLFPPIAAVVGPRLLGALACIASTAAFTRLLRGRATPATTSRSCGSPSSPSSTWWSAGCRSHSASRSASAPSLRSRSAGDGGRSRSLCCAARRVRSPAHFFCSPRSRGCRPSAGVGRCRSAASVLGIGAAALFGEGGFFPFPASELSGSSGFCVDQPGARAQAARGSSDARSRCTALASALLYVVPNPIGGNVIRLGAIFAGPLAAYVCMRHRMPVILALVAGPLLAWQLWQVPGAIANGGEGESAHAGYYTGLVDYLHAHPSAGRARRGAAHARPLGDRLPRREGAPCPRLGAPGRPRLQRAFSTTRS